MGLYLGGLIVGRIFAFEIWGAYFREGLLLLFFWGGGGAYYRNVTVLFTSCIHLMLSSRGLSLSICTVLCKSN